MAEIAFKRHFPDGDFLLSNIASPNRNKPTTCNYRYGFLRSFTGVDM